MEERKKSKNKGSPKGKYQRPIISACEEISSISLYCRECRMLLCEECSINHIEHLYAFQTLQSFIQQTLANCSNYESQIQLLKKAFISVDQIKAELFDKIDRSFEKVFEDLREFKNKVKEEIWSKVSHSKIKIEEDEGFQGGLAEVEATVILMKEEMRECMSKLASIDEKCKGVERESIELLQEKIFKMGEWDKQLKPYIRMKGNALSYSNDIKEFILKQKRGTYKYSQIVEFCSPFLDKSVLDDDYYFPNGSKIVRKTDTFLSICSPKQLPKYFRAKLRINNYTGKFFDFGVCKNYFGTQMGQFISWEKDQWSYCEDGSIYYNQGNGRNSQSGNDKYGKDGDILTILYDTNHKLTFHINGIIQPQHFNHLQGPFYLCASLKKNDSEIEIIEVLPLNDN